MKEETTTLTVRLPVEMVEGLKAKAAENDRTVSLEVRRAVRNHLAWKTPPGLMRLPKVSDIPDDLPPS